jgi:hypothetical protein
VQPFVPDLVRILINLFDLGTRWGLEALNVDQCHPIREHVASFARFRSALGADLRHGID